MRVRRRGAEWSGRDFAHVILLKYARNAKRSRVGLAWLIHRGRFPTMPSPGATAARLLRVERHLTLRTDRTFCRGVVLRPSRGDARRPGWSMPTASPWPRRRSTSSFADASIADTSLASSAGRRDGRSVVARERSGGSDTVLSGLGRVPGVPGPFSGAPIGMAARRVLAAVPLAHRDAVWRPALAARGAIASPPSELRLRRTIRSPIAADAVLRARHPVLHSAAAHPRVPAARTARRVAFLTDAWAGEGHKVLASHLLMVDRRAGRFLLLHDGTAGRRRPPMPMAMPPRATSSRRVADDARPGARSFVTRSRFASGALIGQTPGIPIDPVIVRPRSARIDTGTSFRGNPMSVHDSRPTFTAGAASPGRIAHESPSMRRSSPQERAGRSAAAHAAGRIATHSMVMRHRSWRGQRHGSLARPRPGIVHDGAWLVHATRQTGGARVAAVGGDDAWRDRFARSAAAFVAAPRSPLELEWRDPSKARVEPGDRRLFDRGRPSPEPPVTSLAPGATMPPALDITRLASQVYEVIERKYRIERTRRGL
jgi:hypothetical protein